MYMETDAMMTIYVERNIQKDAQLIVNALGMDRPTAINVFLRQLIRCGGFPFELRTDIPNSETLQAMEEVQAFKSDPNKKTYDSFAEILQELGDESVKVCAQQKENLL